MADTTISVYRKRDKRYLKLHSSPSSTQAMVCWMELSETAGASGQTPAVCEHICTGSNHIVFL